GSNALISVLVAGAGSYALVALPAALVTKYGVKEAIKRYYKDNERGRALVAGFDRESASDPTTRTLAAYGANGQLALSHLLTALGVTVEEADDGKLQVIGDDGKALGAPLTIDELRALARFTNTEFGLIPFEDVLIDYQGGRIQIDGGTAIPFSEL